MDPDSHRVINFVGKHKQYMLHRHFQQTDDKMADSLGLLYLLE